MSTRYTPVLHDSPRSSEDSVGFFKHVTSQHSGRRQRILLLVICICVTLVVAGIFHTHKNKAQGGAQNTPQETPIALLIATRSSTDTIETSPLFTVFLPSFMNTLSPNSNFSHTVYLGYDEGDKLLDSREGQIQLHKLFNKATEYGRYNVSLKTFRQVDKRGKPANIWSDLAMEAYNAGEEYFYQLNDDVEFQYTTGWETAFTQYLKKSPVYPGFGLVCPFDIIQTYICTQAFVSRVHLDIFRNFYPRKFTNWWSDTWILTVYQPEYVLRAKDFPIINTSVQKQAGTRYKPVNHNPKEVTDVVAGSQKQINSWLSKKGSKNIEFGPTNL